ncbi:MAG: ABC transporter substrate-binding protein [Balneolaceae bacterium]|nr:ABC transporter substrate-binding protein [Balneolaceae bacterium]
MKPLRNAILSGIAVAIVLGGCASQPETIVINDTPKSPGPSAQPADTAKAEDEISAEFKQMVVGEIHPITTLDPLFADNNSAKRTLQLLYEGLVRYDSSGEITPAIAKRWQVTGDSLTYVFTLRDNLFYHDDNIFSSGVGRKLVARDVKFAFERMAENSVPAHAAELFMDIDGFEPYFNEQRNILNPAFRELEGVSGIQVTSDTTVVFNLAQQDRNFLHKLASPYASIYPREAVTENPGNFAGVGSGPFELSQQVGDSVYIFAKYDDYNPGTKPPVLDRIDVIVEENESNMLKSMGAGDIHVIPEMGPEMIDNMLTDEGTLSPAYISNYTLRFPGGSTVYTLLHNPESGIPAGYLENRLSGLQLAPFLQQFPSGVLDISSLTDTVSSTVDNPPGIIYSSYPGDIFQRWMLQKLSGYWNGDPKLNIVRIRTPTRLTAMYTETFTPAYPGHAAPSSRNMLMRYSIEQSVLSIKPISNLHFNRYPWWIDYRSADMPGIDRL